MAPPGYDPSAVSALRHAVAAIQGLFQTAQMMDDRDEQVPSDLLMTLYIAVEPVKHLIPADHSIIYILPQLQRRDSSEPKRPEPTWKIVLLYGPTMANLIGEIANDLERTNYGAESRPRSPQVTVYVDPTDRERRRQRQTPRSSGNAGQ
jgi:hypothetical protein